MTREKSAIEMAEFWTRQARTGPRYPEHLPWSPFHAKLTAADGTEDQPLPDTPPDPEPFPYGDNHPRNRRDTP